MWQKFRLLLSLCHLSAVLFQGLAVAGGEGQDSSSSSDRVRPRVKRLQLLLYPLSPTVFVIAALGEHTTLGRNPNKC